MSRPAGLYRQALSVKEELLGGGHPEVGLVVNNLGTLLMEQGRHAEAAECLRRALTIVERTYDPGHPLIGRVCRNLERCGIDANGLLGGPPVRLASGTPSRWRKRRSELCPMFCAPAAVPASTRV
jgi:hypothetical protein